MSSNNIEDVFEYVKSKFIELFGNDISEYELRMIRNSIQIVYKEIPPNKLILGNSINDAIKAKSDLHYILMRIKDKRKIIAINYSTKYNKLYTALSRQGRPSKEAIFTEIMYLNPDMKSMNDTLQDFDELIEFLSTQQSIIDMIIRNMEQIRYNLG